jgi:hypothetical protein
MTWELWKQTTIVMMAMIQKKETIYLSSDNDDVMNEDGNNNKKKEKPEGIKSDDNVSLVFSSGPELPTNHSSSEDARSPPSEWYDDLSSSMSVTRHSSDTSEERWTGMSAHRSPTSRQYLKRKEKDRHVSTHRNEFLINVFLLLINNYVPTPILSSFRHSPTTPLQFVHR